MATEASCSRIIIAGGSIAGLGLALCLQKAGIDFLVLERNNDIAPQIGASIAMHPHGNKILDQLGVFSELRAMTTPLMYDRSYDLEGNCFADSSFYRLVNEQ